MKTEARSRIATRFKLHIRCENCVRDYALLLDVPDVEDAPTTVDELIESEFLARQRFTCHVCESAIGNLIGVTTFRRRKVA